MYFGIDKSLAKISYRDLTLENNKSHDDTEVNETCNTPSSSNSPSVSISKDEQINDQEDDVCDDGDIAVTPCKRSAESDDDFSESEVYSDDCDPEYLPSLPKRSRMISSSSSESSFNGFDAPVEYADKEEVYLFHDSKVLFKAIVFKELEAGNPDFLKLKIVKVYHKNVMMWIEFDWDKHAEGSFIKWNKCQIKKIASGSASDINDSLGLEADHPNPLNERKKKKNPGNWKKTKKGTIVVSHMNTKRKKVKIKQRKQEK